MEIREYHRATECDHRGRFRRCREPLLGQCQYCARGFCARHGERLDDGQEICTLERCQLLRADVARHLIFKDAARARNAESNCGEPDCQQGPTDRCDRCLCMYCRDHLRQVIITVTRGGELHSEAQTICDHCRARLPLWSDQ